MANYRDGPKHDYPKIFAKKVEDIPIGEHFAILVPGSAYIPGDERSRTNPGHGYPEHSIEYWNYEIYENKEKWEQAIQYMKFHNRPFVPIHAVRPNVETKFIVQETVKPSY